MVKCPFYCGKEYETLALAEHLKYIPDNKEITAICSNILQMDLLRIKAAGYDTISALYKDNIHGRDQKTPELIASYGEAIFKYSSNIYKGIRGNLDLPNGYGNQRRY